MQDNLLNLMRFNYLKTCSIKTFLNYNAGMEGNVRNLIHTIIQIKCKRSTKGI